MAAKRGKKKSDFMQYLVMGAGFAAGAAIISVAITGLTIGVNEAYKMVSSKMPSSALPPGVDGGSLPY